MKNGITVRAPAAEVTELLQNQLSADEYQYVRVSTPRSDPFTPAPARDLGIILSIVEFSASAIVGGVIYDVAKRTVEILKAHYGDRIEYTDDPSKTDDDQDQSG